MLELARGVAQWAHGFKSGILFLFNTGEEEGLDGAHSFITQVSIFKLHTHITHVPLDCHSYHLFNPGQCFQIT